VKQSEWIMLDTETNGLLPPIAVVELAAQRMRGWEPVGLPFRFLLNQNAEISPEASRVNGYTREILERDGEQPLTVYRAFADYVGDSSLVSFNLSFDLDQVLVPEWQRFGVPPVGARGFCALRLAQRLLDPVPAGNCKLQTLRQYYRLPERGAHTAMGDVETTIDLLRNVLRPIALKQGLTEWQHLKQFTEDEWFPSRLTFGKHKGRDYTDALTDGEFRQWLEWLSTSTNERSARMGHWYLGRLSEPNRFPEHGHSQWPFPAPDKSDDAQAVSGQREIALLVDHSRERLQELIGHSRARLAKLEAEFTDEKSSVDAVNAALFRLVRQQYQRRDNLKLIVSYRRLFRDTLIGSGDEEAERVSAEYKNAQDASDREYADADRFTSDKANLTDEQKAEIKQFWKKLVRLYHPDLFQNDPEKQATYDKLIQAINEARDKGDIDVLREIANDPDGYIAKKEWGKINISNGDAHEDLLKLYRAIEMQIVERIEALERLRESAEYELMKQCKARPGLLDDVAEQQKLVLTSEIEKLEKEAKALAVEIEELTGSDSGV
jgi:DNA polymerase III epsilon subunit-like protein